MPNKFVYFISTKFQKHNFYIVNHKESKHWVTAKPILAECKHYCELSAGDDLQQYANIKQDFSND